MDEVRKRDILLSAEPRNYGWNFTLPQPEASEILKTVGAHRSNVFVAGRDKTVGFHLTEEQHNRLVAKWAGDPDDALVVRVAKHFVKHGSCTVRGNGTVVVRVGGFKQPEEIKVYFNGNVYGKVYRAEGGTAIRFLNSIRPALSVIDQEKAAQIESFLFDLSGRIAHTRKDPPNDPLPSGPNSELVTTIARHCAEEDISVAEWLERHIRFPSLYGFLCSGNPFSALAEWMSEHAYSTDSRLREMLEAALKEMQAQPSDPIGKPSGDAGATCG